MSKEIQKLPSFPECCKNKTTDRNGTTSDDLDPRTVSLFKRAAKNIGLFGQWAEDVAIEAAQYLQYEDAVSLLRSEDFFKIVHKMVFLGSMTDPNEKPFYSLEELEHITELYLIFLEKNSSHIIDSGYTHNSFTQCPWLDLNFSNIYPAFGSLEFVSRWNQEEEIQIVQEPSKIRLLSDEDARIIEDERSSLYEFKILILHTLLSALRTRDTKNLMNTCLKYYKEYFFDGDKAKYYSRIDKIYAEEPLILPQLSFPLAKPNPGGMTSIRNLIVHYIQELEYGMKSRVRTHLNDIVTMDQNSCQHISIDSYFELMHREENKSCFDKAFFLYLSQMDIEDTIFNAYQEKISNFFSKKEDPPVETDHPITIDSIFSEDIPPLKQHIFCRKGSSWIVVFGEQRTFVPHTKGMYYIQQLLENPRQEISVFELEAYVNPQKVYPTREEVKQLQAEAKKRFDIGGVRQDPKTGELHWISFPTSPGDFFDKETRDQIRAQIKILKKNRPDDDSIEFLAKYLSAGCGLWGGLRKSKDPWEDGRRRVDKCMTTAGKNIVEPIPKLWVHLNGFLKYTTYYHHYSPDQDIHWITHLSREKKKKLKK